MSDPTDHPDDDALDARVRAAAGALLALAPDGRLDGIEAKVLDDLAQIDRRGAGVPASAVQSRTESRMMSDRDKTPGRDPVNPPSTPARTEDSGLHDIKALAQDTKKRISRRITSQHDAYDESLLSSSHSGLRAVALPEPARLVSLPEVPGSLEDIRAAAAGAAFSAPAAAAASEAISVAPAAPRKKTALWIGAGVAVAAAAAVAVVLSGGGDKKDAEPQVAATTAKSAPDIAPAEVAPIAEGAVVGRAAGAGSAVPTDPPAADPGAAPGAGAAPAGAAVAVADPDDKEERPEAARVRAAAPKPGGDKPADADGARRGGTTAAATGTGAGSAKVEAPKGGAGAKVETPKGAVAVKPPAGKPGEKSIEDLLNDASGGAARPKEETGGGGGGDSAPAKPEKTSLSTSDIKGGMSGVAGKAQACFGQHGVAGHVKVRATIAPSGAVTKADATGEFAGTPTGACVAAAVKGASFPEWTGSSMTVSYAFTLQE